MDFGSLTATVSKGATVPAETHSNQPVTRAEIASLIASQLAEILEKDAGEITETATFESLGADSLALIELVEALEDELSERASGFRIDDEDLEDLLTVADAVNYVAAKLGAS
jgi:acyl carrier protein